MSDDVDELQLDKILSILENPIRRKILMKLSRDTNYPLQLSRELNVSQQAVMKHLKVLEESDFVKSFEERSDKGGPPRKVYIPRKRYCVRIDIGPNTYSEEYYSYRSYDIKKRIKTEKELIRHNRLSIRGKVTGEMKNDVVAALPAFTDPVLEDLRIRLESTIDQTLDNQKMEDIRLILMDLNNEISDIEKKRKSLLAIRERTFQEANALVSSLFKDPIEKEILSIYMSGDKMDIDELSERLNTRKAIIEEVMDKLNLGRGGRA